jgi:hypothetical protein
VEVNDSCGNERNSKDIPEGIKGNENSCQKGGRSNMYITVSSELQVFNKL